MPEPRDLEAAANHEARTGNSSMGVIGSGALSVYCPLCGAPPGVPCSEWRPE